MGNNPVRFNDPTGHTVDCGLGDSCDAVNRYVLKKNYNWRLKGRWSLKEFDGIYEAGRQIESYINRIADGKGLAWMQKYMGGTFFEHGGLFGKYSYVTGSTVHVEGASWDNGGIPNTIVHELAHIWDNNSMLYVNYDHQKCAASLCGGGDADTFTKFLGGSTFGPRPWNGTSGIPIVYQWSKVNNYGNHGAAESFADTFRYTIYKGYDVPLGFSDMSRYMEVLIKVDALSLP